MFETILLALKQLRYNLVRTYPFLQKMIQPAYKTPSSSDSRVKLGNGIFIRNIDDIKNTYAGVVTQEGDRVIWDLKGFIVDGINQTGDGSQNESQEPLFTVELPKLTIRNFFFDNVKESIHWYAPDGIIEDGVFLKIGEDAISTYQPKDDRPVVSQNLTIQRVHFQNWGGDKSVQLNTSVNCSIIDCTFVGNNTGIRWGSEVGTTVTHTGFSKGNKFYGVRTIHHASGPRTTLTVDSGSETYVWAKEINYTNYDAKIVNKKF